MIKCIVRCASVGLLVFGGIASSAPAQQSNAGKIPLCPGLTIVTTVSTDQGDVESLKVVEATDTAGVHVHYSAEFPPEKVGGAIHVRRINETRLIRAQDLRDGSLYLQWYGTNIPVEASGTTGLGTSTAVLRQLKVKGQAELGLFEPESSSSRITADRTQHPNIFDYVETYKLLRVEPAPVKFSAIVNGIKMDLPAIHAAGRSNFYGYKAEFFFLDDESNPLALSWRLGIGSGSGARAGGDRDTLKVIKIAYHCSGSSALLSRLEKQLAETGHADIYDIYFSFNSDQIREESGPTLHEISEVMHHHPDWKLSIAGHTDAIGGDASNMDLSKRRAAAVKSALVTNYQVAANRLTTTGYGKSRPVDTNDTEEGRARNRRVELTRQ